STEARTCAATSCPSRRGGAASAATTAARRSASAGGGEPRRRGRWAERGTPPRARPLARPAGPVRAAVPLRGAMAFDLGVGGADAVVVPPGVAEGGGERVVAVLHGGDVSHAVDEAGEDAGAERDRGVE